MRISVYLVTAVFFTVAAASVYASPVLKIDEAKFDFGEVVQGVKVPHIFEFTNVGDEPLKIDRVRSSCGCTAVLLSEKVLPPGGSGELRANFDSTRFHGDVKKTIYLYSNDPVRPTLQLYLKGKVTEPITVNPAQINFGTVPAEKTVSKTILLHNQSGKVLTLGKPLSTATGLSASLQESTFAIDQQVTLDVQLTPSPGQKRFSGYVLVSVKGLPKKELRIPVYALIDDPR